MRAQKILLVHLVWHQESRVYANIGFIFLQTKVKTDLKDHGLTGIRVTGMNKSSNISYALWYSYFYRKRLAISLRGLHKWRRGLPPPLPNCACVVRQATPFHGDVHGTVLRKRVC